MPPRHTVLATLVLFLNVALYPRQAKSPRWDRSTAAYKLFRIIKELTAGDDIKAMLDDNQRQDISLHTVIDDVVPHSSDFNWFWLSL